jgi:hypothetical protein
MSVDFMINTSNVNKHLNSITKKHLLPFKKTLYSASYFISG